VAKQQAITETGGQNALDVLDKEIVTRVIIADGVILNPRHAPSDLHVQA
jgi:hypothetical protein